MLLQAVLCTLQQGRFSITAMSQLWRGCLVAIRNNMSGGRVITAALKLLSSCSPQLLRLACSFAIPL